MGVNDPFWVLGKLAFMGGVLLFFSFGKDGESYKAVAALVTGLTIFGVCFYFGGYV